MTAQFKAVLAVALLAVYLVAATYPFRWQWPAEPNLAAWDQSQSIRFSGPGILRSQDPPSWVADAKRTHRLEIALSARTFSVRQAGPARLFTLSRDPLLRDLTIAQDGADLVVRLRTPQTNLNGIPAHQLGGVFRDDAWKDIRVSIAPERLAIEVNGARPYTAPLPPEALSNWDASYLLALGNELTHDRPWRGEIRRAQVSVGGSSFDYISPGLLYAPGFLWPGRAPQLNPFKDLNLTDVLINFFGFLPLGVFLALGTRGRRQPAGLTLVALIAATSLGLELLQLGFVGRYTSTSDFLLNTAGGAAGLFLLRLYWFRPPIR
jgi:VanZ like protein